MHLSTSSSESHRSKGDHGMERSRGWLIGDRIAAEFAILLGFVLSITFAMNRSDSRYASEPKSFFTNKAGWVGEAEIVVAGDSRVYRAVSPRRIRSETGRVVLNFGFSSAMYCGEYVQGIESVLRRDAKLRVVVLGVSPFSFRDCESIPNGYSDSMKKLRARGRFAGFQSGSDWFARRFGAIDTELVLDAAGIRAKTTPRPLEGEYLQIFHEDGWVASDRLVPDAERSWLQSLEEKAGKRPVDETVFDDFLGTIGEWADSGILVLGFRNPTSMQVARREDELWPIDWDRLRAVIETNGGAWLSPETDRPLRNYDASHIDAESAVRFSSSLGIEILKSIDHRLDEPLVNPDR
jgi:hypothetical protein